MTESVFYRKSHFNLIKLPDNYIRPNLNHGPYFAGLHSRKKFIESHEQEFYLFDKQVSESKFYQQRRTDRVPTVYKWTETLSAIFDINRRPDKTAKNKLISPAEYDGISGPVIYAANQKYHGPGDYDGSKIYITTGESIPSALTPLLLSGLIIQNMFAYPPELYSNVFGTIIAFNFPPFIDYTISLVPSNAIIESKLYFRRDKPNEPVTVEV